jgi:hypothetical protein
MTDTLDTTVPPEAASSTEKAPASASEATPAPAEKSADLDLLDTGDPAVAAPPAEPADNADRPAWQRPDGLEGDALAQWKEAQGLPTDAAGYEIDLGLGEGQSITETGQQLIDGLKEFAVANDLPAPTVSGLVKWYDAQLKAQQAKLAEGDKTLRASTHATLSKQWGSIYDQRIKVAKEGAKLFPESVREMLKTARTPDGRRVSDTPEFAEALLAIGRLAQKGKNVPTSDEDRLAEIDNVMNTDIDAYKRQGLDQERLALMRKAEAKGQTRTPGSLTAAEAQEEREIVQLMNEDVGTYMHKMWRGSGRTASDRLLELRRKRAGDAA